MYIHIYIYIYTCIYICTYTYIYIRPPRTWPSQRRTLFHPIIYIYIYIYNHDTDNVNINTNTSTTTTTNDNNDNDISYCIIPYYVMLSYLISAGGRPQHGTIC